MSKHIFLTGEVQIGKSTVIDRVLSALELRAGGFRTAFDGDRAKAERWLYIWDAAQPPAQDESHGVVRFRENCKPEILNDRFDVLGGGALRRARESGAGLILMDECGRFEERAAAFQREIFAALDGDIPVLGVVRQGYHGWLDTLREHPKVEVLTVTAENRDALPAQIIQKFKQK